MVSLASVFASSFVGALGWALLHFLWQGALVALLAGVALHVLRDARPQLRYVVALGALALCVLLPFAQLLAALPSAGAPVAEAPAVLALAGEAGEASLRGWIDAHMAALVAAWLGCVALLTLRLAAGMLWVERLTRTACASAAPLQARLDALAGRMCIARSVPLLIAQGLDSPVAAGILRPVVLVPAALVTGMPVALLEALLAHELAHVQRHDYLVNLLQGAAEILLFYHPAVWWLSRRVRIEREQVADDLAAQALGDARRLAHALQVLAQYQDGAMNESLAPAARGGNLLARIQRLLLPHARPSAWQAGVVLPAVALACAMLAAPAGSTTVALEQETKKEAPAAPPAPAAMAAPAAPAAPAAKAIGAAPMVKAPKPVVAPPAAPAMPVAPVPPTAPAKMPAAAATLPAFPVTIAERDAGMPLKKLFDVKEPTGIPNSCDESQRPAKSMYADATRHVVINVLVSADGRVANSSVAHGSGVPELDQATRRYAASCRYEAGTVGGQPAELNRMVWYAWNAPPAPKPADADFVQAMVDSKQCKKPEYPAEALAQGRTGAVVMEFLVGVDGKVKDGRFFKSSGHRDLDVSALEALKLCQFTPARRKDVAEESWTKMMYVWQLQ